MAWRYLSSFNRSVVYTLCFVLFYHHKRCCLEYTALKLGTFPVFACKIWVLVLLRLRRILRVPYCTYHKNSACFPPSWNPHAMQSPFSYSRPFLLLCKITSSWASAFSHFTALLLSPNPSLSHFQFHLPEVLKSPHPKEKNLLLLLLSCCFPSIYYTTWKTFSNYFAIRYMPIAHNPKI